MAAMAVVLVNTPWGHERIRRILVSQSARLLAGRLEVGSLGGSLFRGPTLRGVRLVQDGQPLLTADEIRLSYTLWGFTPGAIDIDEVVLHAPVVAVLEHPRGWNVAQMLVRRADSAPGQPRPVTIRKISIVNGRVRVVPKGAPARDLTAVQFDGALSIRGQQVSLTSNHLQATEESGGLTIRELTASAVIEPERIAVTGLTVVTAATRLEGHVRLTDRGTQPIIDADLTADPMSLLEISRYVPALRTFPDLVNIRLRARGPLNALAARWTFNSAAGKVGGESTVNLSGPVRTVRSTVDLAAFNLAEFISEPELVTKLTGKLVVSGSMPEGGWNATTWRYQIDAPSVAFQDYRATDVHARGTYRASSVTAEGRGVAYGTSATFDLTWRGGPGTFSVTGDARDLDLRRLPQKWGAPQLSTDLAARYQFAMDRRGWVADATLQNSIVEGARLSTGTTAHLESRENETEHNDVTYAISGHVSSLNPDHLRQVLGSAGSDPRLKGEVDGDFRLDGRGRVGALLDHDATASIRLAPSTLGDVHVEHLQASGTLRARVLTADVAGRVQATPRLPAKTPATTQVTADLEAHVFWRDVGAPLTPTSLEGTITLDVAESTVTGLAIERAHVDVAVERGIASLNRVDIQGPALKVNASGTIALDDRGQSEMAFVIDASDLAPLAALVFQSQPVAGTAHLEGRVGGTRASTTVIGTFSGHSVSRATVSALTLNGEYSVEVPNLDLSRARITTTLDSTFLQAGAYKLDRLTVTAKYVASTLDLTAKAEQPDRTVTAEAAVSLAPDRREVRLRKLVLDRRGLVWQLATPDAVVRYGTEIAVEGLSISAGSGRVTIDGALPVKSAPQAASAITMTADRVSVADLDTLFLESGKLEGQLDGTATVTGALDAPKVAVDMRISAGKAGGIPFESFTTKAEYGTGVAKIDAELRVDATGALTIRGTVPTEGPGLDVRANASSLQMALLSPLLTSYVTNLGGGLTLDVHATGSLKAPSVRGDVNVIDGQFRLVPTGADYRRLNTTIHFDGDKVAVDELTVEDHDGHPLTMSGTSAGAGTERSVDFVAKSSGIHVLQSELGDVAMRVDLRGKGSLVAPHIEGRFAVERGRLEVDKILSRLTSRAYRPVGPVVEDPAAPVAAPETPPAPARFSQASMDLQVDIPSNLVMRGRDLRTSVGSIGLGDVNLTAGGSLQVTKDAAAPTVVLGQVTVVRGHYSFQGRRFELETGSDIRMRGGELMDMLLNLTATREISGLTARVTVGGTLRQPQITLSSDPPLDPGDVLSLIVFNQPVNELGESQQASLAERAGLLAAGAVTTPLTDSVARMLDLDVFEIRQSEAGGAGAIVTVGRQVSDQLFVGFRHEFGQDETSRVSFEYRLRSFLRIVTSVGQTNPSSNRIPRGEMAGLDLFFVIKR